MFCFKFGSGENIAVGFFFRLSQQLAITEVHFYGTNQHPVVREQLNVNLSSEAIKEKEVLGFMDRLLSKTTLSCVKVCDLLDMKTE